MDVRWVFSNVSKVYETMNTVLSFSRAKYWRKYWRKKIPFDALLQRLDAGQESLGYMDLACGQGISAHDVLSGIWEKWEKKSMFASSKSSWGPWLGWQNWPIETWMVDPCEAMLKEAQKRIIFPRLHWVLESAENLTSPLAKWTEEEPSDVLDLCAPKCLDLCTLTFGLRNIAEPLRQRALKNVYRCLGEGGWFMGMELTLPFSNSLSFFYQHYLKLLPLIGEILVDQREAYAYLADSIQKFGKPSYVKELLIQSGFDEVEIEALDGGICTLFWAKRTKSLEKY